MQKKRNLTNLQKFKLYFNTAPFLLGEVLLITPIFGVLYFFTNNFDWKGLFSLLAIIPSYFFLKNKIKTLSDGTKALENGISSIATLKHIKNTWMQHNKRTIKEYCFEYNQDNKVFKYYFDSAYHRELKEGDVLDIYYLAENPNIAIIPSLYKIEL